MIKAGLQIIILLMLNCSVFAQKIDFPKPNIDISKIDVSKIDLSKLNMENFTFGFKITPSISWVDVNHYDLQAGGADLKLGIGGIAEYSINNFISVVSGVNYTGFGGYVFDNKSLNDPDLANNYKINYSQIDVPLNLKVKTPNFKKISYYLQGGLSSGFVLTATENYKKINSNQVIQPVDIIQLTNPSNAGFNVTVGCEFILSKNLKFFTDFAYKKLITNTANSDSYISSGRYSNQSTLEIYPGSMVFSLGLLFK